jgi:CRP/FNR family cyclic AMP-dependent transcriptional regulator
VGNSDTAFRVRSAYERVFEPGQTVISEGAPGDKLYVIQSGEIELARQGAGGHRAVARLGPGDFFGELALVKGLASSARAVAVTRTCVLELDRETLEGMCMAQPAIAIRLIRILVARLIEAERRLALLGADELLRPMVRAIQRQAEPTADARNGFRVATTLRGLSEETGLSMLEAHRALHQLFDRKLLHLLDDCLHVPDLEALSGCLDAAD